MRCGTRRPHPLRRVPEETGGEPKAPVRALVRSGYFRSIGSRPPDRLAILLLSGPMAAVDRLRKVSVAHALLRATSALVPTPGGSRVASWVRTSHRSKGIDKKSL